MKKDVLGRLRIPKERREALLAEYDGSGMSGAAFAPWAGIKYPTFASWLQARRQQRAKGAGEGGPVQWVEAVLEKPAKGPVKAAGIQSGGMMCVEGPSGIRLELGEERHFLWAAKLLRHLGEPC